MLLTWLFVCCCFSDGPSSDTSSYELEQPSLLRFLATSQNASPDNNDQHAGQATGHADVVEDEPVPAPRYVSSSELANSPDDGTPLGAENPPVNSADLIVWADEVSSATTNERSWLNVTEPSVNTAVQHTNSHTSLLSANV